MVSTLEKRKAAQGLFAIVGFLVCVEVASGILQGYYTPIFSDIADHLSISDADVNWFEAAQLIVSALCVPLAGPPRRPGRAQEGAAALDRRHRARLVDPGGRAELHDLPDRLGDPGRVRRVVAARGRDHLPAHRRHRSAGAPHPALGGDPGRRPRAVGDHRRAHQRRPRRVHLDDLPARPPRDRRHAVLLRDLVRHRERRRARRRRHRLARVRPDHRSARAGDGRPDRDPPHRTGLVPALVADRRRPRRACSPSSGTRTPGRTR